jgi:hypothetical protein
MAGEFGCNAANGSKEMAEFVISDEQAFCDLDARLKYSEITFEDCTGPAGRLSLVSIDDIARFSRQYQEQLGVSGVTGPALLIGGGLAQFRAGAWTRAKDGQGRAAVVSAMVRKALTRARENGSRAIGLFVADPDVGAFQAAADAAPRSQPRYGWCTLELNGARTLDEFFNSQPRKSRQTWHRDQRDGERLGLVHEVVGFDDEITRAAAPLIADVSRRNGLAEHHQLTRWRMSGYRKRPGQSSYIRVSNDRGVVAYTACRTWGTALQAHTVGIDPTVSDRRSVYHYSAYLAPLAAALEAGLSQVEYGIAHEQPKLARGCHAVTVWQVDFRSR